LLFGFIFLEIKEDSPMVHMEGEIHGYSKKYKTFDLPRWRWGPLQ